MSLQIAQAAVDDATIHFDKLYSYCIPPRLNDKVWPGSMVLVPFGRGNKPRMAVVLSVAELPEGADTQKLKTLYDAAPAEARLTPDLLELVRFLKDRTFCTWFEAIKAVIPYGAQYRAAVENGRPVMQNRLSRSTERLYTLAGELPAKPKPGPRQLAAMEALSTGPKTARQLDEAGIDPWHDVLDLEQFRAAFGKVIHPFTGVDYVDFYKGIIEDAGAQAEIVFANRVQTVLDYTDTVICCDIHTRQRSKRLLKKAGARVVLGLDDLLTAPVNGSGYNPQYGLLGSNKADDTRVKLFPRDADVVAEAIGQRLSEATGKRIEAMVYGDGAFKVWELADPVVSPGYTAGLEGTPNELKLKYLADHDFGDLSGEALQQAVAQKIREKDASVSLVGNMVSEGTTPRHLTDLIGSLCDLTSGSGDKGTPVIYIQGYFDNYTNE